MDPTTKNLSALLIHLSQIRPAGPEAGEDTL
jgi:hypothetical protein